MPSPSIICRGKRPRSPALVGRMHRIKAFYPCSCSPVLVGRKYKTMVHKKKPSKGVVIHFMTRYTKGGHHVLHWDEVARKFLNEFEQPSNCRWTAAKLYLAESGY